MTVMPLVFCEVAFTRDSAGWPLWQDVSDWTEWEKGVRISRRRSHELDEVQPGKLVLSLLNSDGRFTAGRASSPYYPHVTLNRPIRIRIRWPGSANMLLRGQAQATTTDLFSTNNGVLATSATAPAGQTSSVRWSSASWSVGDIMRLGVNSSATPTDEGMYVVGGATYSVRCQARRETNAVSAQIRIRWYDMAGGIISDVNGTGVALTTSFQAVSFSATAPANAVFARLFLSTSTTGTSAAILSSAWQCERAASPTAWVDPGAEYRRYTGFVDRWPHAWSNGVLGTAQITATDRQKLLARSKIRAALTEEYLSTNPVCYYPLGEPADSTQAGNLAATPQPDMVIQQSGSGGILVFGAKGGPDDSTGVQLSPTDISNGMLLTVSSLTTPIGGTAGVSVAAWVNFGGFPEMGQNRVIFVDNGSDTIHLRVNYAPGTNSLSVGARLPAGAAAASTTSLNLDDGQLHLIVAVAEFVAGVLRLRAYVDGVLAFDTATGLTGTVWPSLIRIRVGGLPGTALDPPEMMEALVSHVAAWNSALTLTNTQSLSAARTGFAGELSGARIARIATWAGVAHTAIDPGASLLDRHPKGDQSPWSAFKQVATSEAGLVFVSGDDAVTFHERGRRSIPTAPDISLAAHQCGVDLQFVLDDQLLINDVTVARNGATVTRVIDQASIDENEGVAYAASIDTLLYSDTEAINRATYTVTTYGYPQPRASQISVDAHSLGTVWPQMLGSEIGQRIEITGLPSEAVTTDLELWCEGVQDVITDGTWTFVMDTSPVRDTPVFILDDPVYGTLDFNYLGW